MADIKITIKLFGAFRKYGAVLDFNCPAGCSVGDVKSKLAELVDNTDKDLIADSAIANDSEVISVDAVFNEDTQLAILPPVCGG